MNYLARLLGGADETSSMEPQLLQDDLSRSVETVKSSLSCLTTMEDDVDVATATMQGKRKNLSVLKHLLAEEIRRTVEHDWRSDQTDSDVLAIYKQAPSCCCPSCQNVSTTRVRAGGGGGGGGHRHSSASAGDCRLLRTLGAVDELEKRIGEMEYHILSCSVKLKRSISQGEQALQLGERAQLAQELEGNSHYDGDGDGDSDAENARRL